MFQELLTDLRKSMCVLVGLGESFTLKNPEDELKYIQFYKTLKEKLGVKDYYVLTQAEDDLIYQCGFDKKHVVAPLLYPEDEESWNKYIDWASMSLNRQMLVLELGVGFSNPMIIRFPFERTVAYNQRAKMYRVHPTFPQVTADVGERGTAVMADPLNLFVEE